METFADELRNLIESWRGRDGISDGYLVDVLMDEIDRLEDDDDE